MGNEMKDEIEIKIKKHDGSIEPVKVKAEFVGDLCVHEETELNEDKLETTGYWVVTGIAQGMKFPGSTLGYKSALACAGELMKIGVDWNTFDGTDKGAIEISKGILRDWGFE